MLADCVPHVTINLSRTEFFEAVTDFVKKRRGVPLPTPVGGYEAIDVFVDEFEPDYISLCFDVDVMAVPTKAGRAYAKEAAAGSA